jgi:hypothetical protein
MIVSELDIVVVLGAEYLFCPAPAALVVFLAGWRSDDLETEPDESEPGENSLQGIAAKNFKKTKRIRAA